MKLHLIAVGHRMEDWVTEAYRAYAKRMPREMPLLLKELKPAQRAAGQTANRRLLDTEAAQIEAALPQGSLRVVLDEHGRTCDTAALAQRMDGWKQSGRDVSFVIGGADGLAAAVKDSADWLWSLSPLTLPHGMVRVILAEQLYRASSILAGHPYHRP